MVGARGERYGACLNYYISSFLRERALDDLVSKQKELGACFRVTLKRVHGSGVYFLVNFKIFFRITYQSQAHSNFCDREPSLTIIA